MLAPWHSHVDVIARFSRAGHCTGYTLRRHHTHACARPLAAPPLHRMAGKTSALPAFTLGAVTAAAVGIGLAVRARRVAQKAAQRQVPVCVAAAANIKVVSKLEEFAQQPALLIGTHDGSFHCDEVCATALLKMLPQYETAAVVRTRDPSLLDQCNVVVDVGAVYEPDRHRYDHHQRTFTDTMAELGHKTRLSSFGLVYRHFGMELIRRIASTCGADGASLDVNAIYKRVYKSFVEHIDGIDNGIEAFDSDKRNYEVGTTLSSRVGGFNPAWNENFGPEEQNARFAAAVELAAGEIAGYIQGCIRHWWPARALVKEALDGAEAIHPSRQVVLLPSYCPWTVHLFQLEAEMEANGDTHAKGAAKYVVFGDSKGDSWRIQAVPITEESFTSRRGLPESWRGLRDDKLSDHINIKDCVFIHAAGFIGGHKTKEGALAMALKAIAT